MRQVAGGDLDGPELVRAAPVVADHQLEYSIG